MAKNKSVLSSMGTRIQNLRTEASMTQSDLSDELNVSRETINHWERDSREIKATQILKLAELFNVTCDYILNGVSTENVETHKVTGLWDDAIDQLKTTYNNGLQGIFPMPAPTDIDFISYTISNKSFMAEYPNFLRDYCIKRLQDDKDAARTKNLASSEETDIASYRLSMLIQKVAENCYTDYFKPLCEIENKKTKSRTNSTQDDNNE